MGNNCLHSRVESSVPKEVNLLPVHERTDLIRKDHLKITTVKKGPTRGTISDTEIEIILNPNDDIFFKDVLGKFLKDNVRKSYFEKVSLNVKQSMHDYRVIPLFDNFIRYLNTFQVKCVELVFTLRKELKFENCIKTFEPATLWPQTTESTIMVLTLFKLNIPLPNNAFSDKFSSGFLMVGLFEVVEIRDDSTEIKAIHIKRMKEKWNLLVDIGKTQKVEFKSEYHWFEYQFSMTYLIPDSKLAITKTQGQGPEFLGASMFQYTGSINFPLNIVVMCYGKDHLHSILLKVINQEMLEERINSISFDGEQFFEESCKEFISKLNSLNSPKNND